MIVWHEQKTAMICIPKTGSTSIREAYKIPTCEPLDYHKTLARGIIEDNIENYYTFAFIRNPYDRLLSGYVDMSTRPSYSDENKKKPIIEKTFEEFVLNLPNSAWYQDVHFMPQVNFIKVGKNISIELMCRFEYLQADLDIVCNYQKLPFVKLSHIRKTNHKSYENYYTTEMYDIVYDLYKEDFKLCVN